MAGGVLFFFIALISATHGALYEGDSCVKDNIAGSCRLLQSCAAAISDLRKRIHPQICSYSAREPIVCCIDSVPTPAPPAPLTTTRRPSVSTTTEYTPKEYDYVQVIEKRDGCGPLPSSLAAPKTGQRAWDKCLEYQESLVYPCVRGGALTGEMGRQSRCHHNAEELIVGGVSAARNEFPHMAILGYGDDVNNLQWLCGGALISDRFILTAGHCKESLDFGVITYVRIGVLRRDDLSSGNRYKIQEIIPYGEYRPPGKYHDIALLKTEKPVALDQFTVPACIHVGNPVKDGNASATGWGVTEYRGNNADVLQKVILTKFTNDDCAASFTPNRNMKQGFDPNTQMCFGDHTASKDTCQGDSGGPLQIKSKQINCMYIIIGVTSFGKACGFAGEPGIYTRVANYLTWIENTVWPIQS